MVAKLGHQFAEDCIQLEKRIGKWSDGATKNLKRVHEIVGVRWKAEAVKRVPVDTSRLKQQINKNVYQDGQFVFVTEVGTNVKDYPIYLEFGTSHIAHGAVLALGTSTEITDAQAIHTWPAKEFDAIAKTSHSEKGGKLYNSSMVQVAGPQEQMPWLRPAFNSIRVWVIDQLNSAIEPPPSQSP
jgi:hypothetical protein